MSEEISSVTKLDLSSSSASKNLLGSGQHLPDIPLKGRIGPPSVATNPKGGFANVRNKVSSPQKLSWSDTMDRSERSQTLSATDVGDSTNLIKAAANAAGEAERLRIVAEKAANDANILHQLAEQEDTVQVENNIVLIRNYSEISLEPEEISMSSSEFANILASLDKLSIKQLKILSSATQSLLKECDPSFVDVNTQQPLVVKAQIPCASLPQTTGNTSVAIQQRATARGRSSSRIRANPTQGGVRSNKKGGRIDYDNKVYINPSGKRYRMQMPRPRSATRIKAETQLQTVIRRLKSFADTNGIKKDCQPVVGSALEKDYFNLLAELDLAKIHLKGVKSKEKPAAITTA